MERPSSFLSHLCLLWSLWFLFLLLSHSFLRSYGLQRYLKQENAYNYKGWKREWGLRDEQSPHVRKCKTVLDSGLHAVVSRWIPLFVRETYIFLIPILREDFGFLEWYSVFQSPEFRITQAKLFVVFGFQNYAGQFFPDSGIRMRREQLISFMRIGIVYLRRKKLWSWNAIERTEWIL